MEKKEESFADKEKKKLFACFYAKFMSFLLSLFIIDINLYL